MNLQSIQILFFLIFKTTNSDVAGSIIIQDYTTQNENVKLFKGQHVNLIQKLNNENCLIQIINNEQQQIELIVPISIIKIQKQSNKVTQPSSSQQVDDFYSKN